MALEKEMETYHSKLPALLAEQGKYVLICGDQVKGIYGTYEDALSAGYRERGITPFLVKKIASIEQVHSISRN